VAKDINAQAAVIPIGRNVVLEKAKRILEENKLDITKTWLSRLISQIDDLQALEQFPTQDTIRTSVELIEGLANCLADEDTLSQFGPGGLYHRQASALGLLQHDESAGIGPLTDSLDALQDAILQAFPNLLTTKAAAEADASSAAASEDAAMAEEADT
jgi:hypothetical protein